MNKTLYININGESIQYDENVEVIGSTEDAVIDSFYISLGMAIADGITGIKYKPLIADFAKAKPEEFKSFTRQWNEVKALLLGDNPSGDVDFVLSSEYLEWLKMNSSYSDIYYKKYQGQREAKVILSLDELYEDTVDAIRRKVIRFLGSNGNCKNFDEFVVNDETVTRRSLLVRSIKSKFEDIAFVMYEKWLRGRDACPKCGKAPCECPPDNPARPKCGKNPFECKKDKNDNHGILFVTTHMDRKEKYDSWKYYETEIFDIHFQSVLKVRARIYKQEIINNHDVLLLEEPNERSFIRISVDSIEQSLTRDQIELESDGWSNDDVRKLERFLPQYKGGLEYIGKSGDDYVFYGYKDELRERNNADVVTSQGKMLFSFKREDGIVVNEVLPSGLLLMERCEDCGLIHYGIADRQGKTLLPCVYDKMYCEKQPGIIKFNNEKYYLNAYTREQYVDVAGEYGLKIKSEDNDSHVDIACITDGVVIQKDVTIDNNPDLKELGDGWYLVKVLKRTGPGKVEKVSIAFNKERLLFLEENETILKVGDRSSINNDRMITTVGLDIDTYSGWCNYEEIRIRDFGGNVIKAITSPRLYITNPYNFGKLAAFKIGEDGIAWALVYFDMQGDEHRIPFNIERFHYSNLWACFVAETTLVVINAKRGNCALIDIDGNILFQEKNTFVLQ